MPLLQYVGVAADVPAYGDPRGANPSLVYARTAEPHTRMKYRRDEASKVTTYEWAIRAYDRFPDAPTKLVAGQRIGFDVAVVDKDSAQPRSAFVTWGSPPEDLQGIRCRIARRAVPRRRTVVRRRSASSSLAKASSHSSGRVLDHGLNESDFPCRGCTRAACALGAAGYPRGPMIRLRVAPATTQAGAHRS